jgi:hypothetical protein
MHKDGLLECRTKSIAHPPPQVNQKQDERLVMRLGFTSDMRAILNIKKEQGRSGPKTLGNQRKLELLGPLRPRIFKMNAVTRQLVRETDQKNKTLLMAEEELRGHTTRVDVAV